MRRVSPNSTPDRPLFVRIARALATLALAFLLAAVIAPRLVNAHDTLQLVLAVVLYAVAAGVLAWGAYDILTGLRRRRPPNLERQP